MAKKVRYYYDPEDCSFKEDVVSPRQVLKGIFWRVAQASLLAALLFVLYLRVYDDPKYKMLQEQNESLTGNIATNLDKIKQLETAITDLHERDNEFYRSILNAEPIENGMWNGGIGGSTDFDPAGNQPLTLVETQKRLKALEYKISLQGKSYEELVKLAEKNDQRLSHIPAIKPVPGKLISSFGRRLHPIFRIRKMHTGLDFQANIGTEVVATGDGTVITAGRNSGGYGYEIEIDHGFGFVTKYAHLKKDGIKVKVGQKVKRGDFIGLSGNTGTSKGPHLHYEIIKDGVKIDPLGYFYADLTPEEYMILRKEAEGLKDGESMD